MIGICKSVNRLHFNEAAMEEAAWRQTLSQL